MAKIWEIVISILAGNLNSGSSYLITTAVALFSVKLQQLLIYSRRATPARYLALIIRAKKANGAMVGEVGAKEKVAMKKIQEILPTGIRKVKTKKEVDIQKVKILLDIIWSKR